MAAGLDASLVEGSLGWLVDPGDGEGDVGSDHGCNLQSARGLGMHMSMLQICAWRT